MGYIDDSDGWLTDISGRIAEVHLEACRAARPDPVELAGRLAGLELTSELDTFHRAATTYAEVLGAEGIAAYRRIVEPKWRKAKTAKDRYAHGVFAVTQAMIGAAQAGGDPDDLIAIRAGDLRAPDDYLEVAESLAAAGRSDDAIDWSRRGLDTFADRHWQTPRLREFLAAQLRAPTTRLRLSSCGGTPSSGTRPSTATASSSPKPPLARQLERSRPSMLCATGLRRETPARGPATRCWNGHPPPPWSRSCSTRAGPGRHGRRR